MGFKSRAAAQRKGGEAEVRALLAAMRGVNPGDWSREAVTAAVDKVAWRGERPALLDTLTREGTELIGIEKAIEVGQRAGDFAQWLELGKETLGAAPVVMGGPGPFVRWRGRERSIELRRRGEAIVVALTATERHEHAEYRIFEWGEGLDGLPYHWIAFRPDPSLDGMTTSGRLVYSWDAIERAIAMTLRTLAGDVVALAGYGLAFKIGMRPRDRSRREVAAVVFYDGRMDVFCDIARPKDRLDDAAMRSLGWQRQWAGKRWRCDFSEATDEVCRRAARTMRATLEAWNVPLAESNLDRKRSLAYYTGSMRGWVKGQDENIDMLPLGHLELAGIGLQRL